MNVTVNGHMTDVSPGATVADVVSALGASLTGTAVAVNGSVVPHSAWTASAVGEGDAVEVLAAVQGG